MITDEGAAMTYNRDQIMDASRMSVQHAERIYSSYSHVYDLFFDAVLEPGRRRAIDALALHRGDRILEVGIGTGLSLPHYPRHCSIVGIDISATMLAKASDKVDELERRDVSLMRMSADAIAFSDATFDRILLSHVIGSVEEPRRVLREVHRVCRRGGRVVLLNHFRSRNPIVARGEHHLTPLTRKLGFVLTIPLDLLEEEGLFRLDSVEKVNMLGVSSLVCCTRL